MKTLFGENIIGAPTYKIVYSAIQQFKMFYYCESNIRLSSIASHLAIALSTLRYQKLSKEIILKTSKEVN